MKKLTIGVLLLATTQAFSFDSKQFLSHDVWMGHKVVQLGGYWTQQGASQNINIEGLIGDRFTVTNPRSSNGLVGLGYYLDGQYYDSFKMAYGVNAFYLGPTRVKGQVIQEQLFTNLSYAYNVTHLPVFAAAKATVDLHSPIYALTLDAGIGPNFIKTGNFHENSLDGITLPDHPFSGHTTTTFAAMAGVGFKLNHVFGQAPLECGYRFFYLGQGNFVKNTNQLLDTLNTGNNYGNAVLCSLTV